MTPPLPRAPGQVLYELEVLRLSESRPPETIISASSILTLFVMSSMKSRRSVLAVTAALSKSTLMMRPFRLASGAPFLKTRGRTVAIWDAGVRR